MNNYIADGNIHPLSDELAYCLKIFNDIEFSNTDFFLSQISYDMIRKYAEYLYDFDKEKVIACLIETFSPNLHGYTHEDVQLIYRPPMNDYLHQKSSLALKFKRAKNDNLDEKLC